MEYTIRKLMVLSSDPIVQDYLRCMEKEVSIMAKDAWNEWMTRRCKPCKARAYALKQVLGDIETEELKEVKVSLSLKK